MRCIVTQVLAICNSEMARYNLWPFYFSDTYPSVSRVYIFSSQKAPICFPGRKRSKEETSRLFQMKSTFGFSVCACSPDFPSPRFSLCPSRIYELDISFWASDARGYFHLLTRVTWGTKGEEKLNPET